MKAYILKYKELFLISTLLGISSFFLVIKIIIPRLNNNVEIVGITGKYSTENLPLAIQSLITEGLTKIDKDKSVKGSIATSWEMENEGKTWKFHINSDLKWNDGAKVKSSDIRYAFDDLVTSYPDENTILFSLKNPYSPFPSVVSKPVFKKGLVGIGDWKITDVNIDGNFVKNLTISSKKGNRYIYKFYPTLDQTKTALKLGEITKLPDSPDIIGFENWQNLKIEPYYSQNEIITIFLNTKDPLLSEKSFRQSLNYAINKVGFDKRALGPISEFSWAYNPQIKRYDYSPDRSRDLIKTLQKNDNKKLSITLAFAPTLVNVAESVADDWKNIGIDVKVIAAPIIPNDFQAYLTIFSTPPDPDQYSVWHTSQTVNNISNFSNYRIDKLLEDGRTRTDIEERKKIYFDFQRYLNEEVPAIFLEYVKYFSISRKY